MDSDFLVNGIVFQIREEPPDQSFVFAKKTQEKVFGLDIRRAKILGFIAGEENNSPGTFCVPLKHTSIPNARNYPIPNSSAASNGVPQRRQITAAQSPHVRGSVTSTPHCGQ